MKHITTLFILVFAVIHISCEKEKQKTTTGQNCFDVTDGFDGTPDLESTWHLIGLVNNLTGEDVCYPTNLDSITISFDAYNRATITSQCNAYTGHYLLKGASRLKIGDVLFGLDGCISDTSKKWERECLDNIEKTTEYEITGDILTLYTGASYNLVFRYGGENSVTEPTCFDFENNYEDVGLTGNWVLLGFIDDEKHCKPDIDFGRSISFTGTDSIYGKAGNFGHAKYQLFEGDSIDLKVTAYLAYILNDTLRYWDSIFIDILRDTRWYDIQGRKLKLYDSEKTSLVFVAGE